MVCTSSAHIRIAVAEYRSPQPYIRIGAAELDALQEYFGAQCLGLPDPTNPIGSGSTLCESRVPQSDMLHFIKAKAQNQDSNLPFYIKMYSKKGVFAKKQEEGDQPSQKIDELRSMDNPITFCFEAPWFIDILGIEKKPAPADVALGDYLGINFVELGADGEDSEEVWSVAGNGFDGDPKVYFYMPTATRTEAGRTILLEKPL